MSTDPEPSNLPAKPPGTGLSVGGLALGLQLALKNALTLEDVKAAAQEHPSLIGFGVECVRLAVKKPPGWQYRLFLHVLKENMILLKDRKTPTVPHDTDPSLAATWILDRIEEYRWLQAGINETLNTALVLAIGDEPGETSEAAIVYVAIQVRDVLCNFMMIRDLALGMLEQSGPYQGACRWFSRFCEQCILEFRQYPDEALNTLMNALANGDKDLQRLVLMDLPILRKDAKFPVQA